MESNFQNFYSRQESRLLKDFDRIIHQIKGEIISRFGVEQTDELIHVSRDEYRRLIPDLPFVGGRQPFTQFVITTGWCLALHRALGGKATSARESGELFFELARQYINQVPALVRRYLGTSMFTQRYQRKLRERALESQQHPLPRGYIFSYIEGEKENYDFGVDYHRCATLNFLREQGAVEIAPYLCALDQYSSDLLGWGLVRTTTLAEGGEVCDFRFKKGGPTRIRSTVLELR
ncbi:MAG: hypothetical protein A2Z71_10050 [Chloroflexi bacterium RBG_13_50_21]|nr:MAG: hypothetical protein A2Z71_10050 [Chloroflexi bacterium RBG_13_50_21]